jgi:hypothetical protein
VIVIGVARRPMRGVVCADVVSFSPLHNDIEGCGPVTLSEMRDTATGVAVTALWTFSVLQYVKRVAVFGVV